MTVRKIGGGKERPAGEETRKDLKRATGGRRMKEELLGNNSECLALQA